MITKEEILAELESCDEPEKKLHEIAERERLPVMVIRKILKGLVTVVPPERGHDNTDRVAESHIEKGVNRGRWSDEDIQYMAECWNRGADIFEIAEAVCRSEQAVRGVMQRHRELFPPPPRARENLVAGGNRPRRRYVVGPRYHRIGNLQRPAQVAERLLSTPRRKPQALPVEAEHLQEG